jgi:Tfp pilus assembly protein PilN
MGKKILGLDISAGAVSAALLESSLKGVRLEASAQVPRNKDDDIAEAIDICMEALGSDTDLSGAVCLAAVPAGQIFFRNIRLPFKEERKIRQVLPYEIEPLLPVSIEDLILDFIPASSPALQDSNQVVAAAIETARVEEVLHALGGVRLDPEVVTVSGYAEAACLAKAPDQPGCWFYVKLDGEQTTVCIASSGQIVLFRRLKADLAQEGGAEDLCRRIDQSRLLAESLCQADLQPEIVYWSGHGDETKVWAPLVAERFHCDAKRVDWLAASGVKWSPTSKPAPVGASGADNPATAIALAELTGAKVLNFRRGPLALQGRWLEYKSALLRTAALLLLVAFLGFFQLYTDIRALGREVDRLDSEARAVFTETFPEVTRIVDPVQQMRVKIQELRKQPDLVGALENGKLKIDLLQALSRRIPANIDVEITRLVIAPDSMSIGGNTSSFNAVNEVKSLLEKDPLFRSVTISSANLEKSGERVNFKLRIEL